MSYKVLLPQPILPEGYAYLLDRGYQVVDGRGFAEEDILADIPDCDAMIVRTAKITGKILDAASKLKIIARHGAGYDNVDLEGARRNKVLVTTAGGANAISVAELAIFYMLYCSRRFKAVMAHCKEDYRYAKMGIQKTELEGKTLGLIGTGNIGKLVAQKAAFGFDMKVLAYDPFAREVPEYIQLVKDRDIVFKESDYVSLHVPATKETTHSVGVRPDEGDGLSHQHRPGGRCGRGRPHPGPGGQKDRRGRPGHRGAGALRPEQSPAGHGECAGCPPHRRRHQGGVHPLLSGLRPGG